MGEKGEDGIEEKARFTSTAVGVFIRVEGSGRTLKGVKCFWPRPWRKFEHERTGGDWIAGGGRREQAGGRAKSGMNGGKKAAEAKKRRAAAAEGAEGGGGRPGRPWD